MNGFLKATSPRTLRARATLLALAALALPSAPLVAQDPGAELRPWNGPRALELVERARARRLEPQADSLLRDYTAQAGGWVYFYLDRRDSDERTLVKTDQVALDLFWRAPDQTKQRIVGMRDESSLPNRMHYHLDHLTVVQNGFGDRIVLGDGDEVRDVPHPAAPGAEATYDYRLVDSLVIRLPGQDEVRAYELQVRPKRMDVPALVGSIFVDRATADLVRMTFTFTPVSYVDRRLDYINISLDNGLWQGRYWLPREQTVEIRRQIPELDFAAGAIIQGRFRVSDYAFNQGLAPELFYGYPVAAAAEVEREAYAFEDELFADLNRDGLERPAYFESLRQEAAELLGVADLSGLPRLRLALPGASSALRYNRAEGVWLGAGITYGVGRLFRADLTGGYGFGSEKPSVALTVDARSGAASRARVRAYLNDVRDMGVRPALAGTFNTLSSAVLGRDYLDPYLASGGRAAWMQSLPARWELEVGATAEMHRSLTLAEHHALLDDSAAFRGVQPVTEGTLTGADVRLSRRPLDTDGLQWDGAATVEVASLGGNAFLRPTAEAALRYSTPTRALDARVRLAGGLAVGTEPLQRRFYLGGPNTLPGYDHRAFDGDAFLLADAEASRDLWSPWIRVRALAAAGLVADLDEPVPPLPYLPDDGTGRVIGGHTPSGAQASAGAGLGLLWDILRVDAWRTLQGDGAWRILLSVNPSLHSIL